MNKIFYKCAVAALLMLLCTTFIFSNSLKDSATSHADSDAIVEIVKVLVSKINLDNKLDWNYVVRKGAHLFEFFLLGVCTSILFFGVVKKRRIAFVCTFGYVIFTASFDELIQRFTGRTSCFSDVLLDLMGAVAGIGLILFLDAVIKRSRAVKK
jgi:VanZ family protein